jgi:hypothetical protein
VGNIIILHIRYLKNNIPITLGKGHYIIWLNKLILGWEHRILSKITKHPQSSSKSATAIPG